MFRLLFSTFILLTFTACVTKSSMILTEPETPKTLSKSTILKIPIPVREHGYKNFETQILSTQKELDDFLVSIKKQKAWNKRENFISSLTLLPIDFKVYNLLLYRMTESSGSTVLAVEAPKGSDQHILIKIGRDKPNMGTADMAYYALAYKVAKTTEDITFDNGLKKDVVKNKTSNTKKDASVPESCLEWYDGCNDCGYVGTANDVVCTERECYSYGKFKCTKWKENKKNNKSIIE